MVPDSWEERTLGAWDGTFACAALRIRLGFTPHPPQLYSRVADRCGVDAHPVAISVLVCKKPLSAGRVIGDSELLAIFATIYNMGER